MGIKGCNQILHIAKDIKLQSLTNFLAMNRKHLKVDIDISWAIFVVAFGKNEASALICVANLISAFANHGYEVTPICDGVIRHRSKRASMDRIRNAEVARIDCIAARFEAAKLSQAISSSNQLESEALKSELLNKNKEIQKFDTKSRERVSCTFGQKLDDYLKENDYYCPDKFSGRIRRVIVAKFQADSVICYRAKVFLSSIIIGNDSDFSMFLGKKYLAISGFKLITKRNKGKDDSFTLKDIQISVTSEDYVKSLESHDSSFKFNRAKFPFFDTDDLNIRGLLALCLGTDVFIGGIPKYGPAKLDKVYQKLKKNDEEELFAQLLNFAAKSLKMTVEEVQTFLYALIHEPGISADHSGPFLYLSEPPPLFPKYIAEFTNQPKLIKNGPEMKECCGVRGNKHLFLIAEGVSFVCSSCERCVCKTCNFLFEAKHYCDECYVSMRMSSVCPNFDPNHDIVCKPVGN